jgi:hypothetical protein
MYIYIYYIHVYYYVFILYILYTYIYFQLLWWERIFAGISWQLVYNFIECRDARCSSWSLPQTPMAAPRWPRLGHYGNFRAADPLTCCAQAWPCITPSKGSTVQVQDVRNALQMQKRGVALQEENRHVQWKHTLQYVAFMFYMFSICS